MTYIPVLLQLSALCSWDSSIHDSVHLNRVSSPNERIYLIIKATVQLSHPASMELVVRKRITVNIYNKQVPSTTGSGVTADCQSVVLLTTKYFTFGNGVCVVSFLTECVSPVELHSESEEANVSEEHSLLLWSHL